MSLSTLSLGGFHACHDDVPLRAAQRLSLSTRPHTRDYTAPELLVEGVDQLQTDDMIRSINDIERVLDDLEATQKRQRRLFHEQADTLVPSLNSTRMVILFEEAALQHSTIIKNINNIKNVLGDEVKVTGHM